MLISKGLNSSDEGIVLDAENVNVIKPTQYAPLPGSIKNLLASVVSKTPLPVLSYSPSGPASTTILRLYPVISHAILCKTKRICVKGCSSSEQGITKVLWNSKPSDFASSEDDISPLR